MSDKRLTDGGPYLWERPAWPDDLVWDLAEVARCLAEAHLAQGRLAGKASLIGLTDRQTLEAQALVDEGVQTSRIEGEILDPASVRSSVLRHLGLPDAAPRRSGRAIEGLVELLVDATREPGRPLTAPRLHGWHSSLFPTGRAGLRPIHVGAFRVGEDPMQVISGALGSPVVHFEAPVSARVPDEMRAFLTWFGGTTPPGDPLLRAALAHLRFVTIHPYDDGNGRIARAVADLVLAGGVGARLWSLSAQVERERDTYYRELQRAQGSDGDITAWMVWHLGCITRALVHAEHTVDDVLRAALFWQTHAARPINGRQRKLIQRLLDASPDGFEGGMTTRKAVALTRASRATAQRDLAELVDWGVLRPRAARGRSAAYDLVWPKR